MNRKLVFIMALLFCTSLQADDWNVTTGYSSNMTMTIRLCEGDEVMTGVIIGAFSGDECRGKEVTGANGMAVLTIQGERYGELISFRVREESGRESVLPVVECFVADQILGTKDYPYEMQLDCILPLDVREGGRFSQAGSLAGKEKLQLGGEGWTSEDMSKLRTSFVSDSILVHTIDFRGISWEVGCDITGLLTDCKELTTICFSALPSSVGSYESLFAGVNPNCLIYVPDGAETGDWKNVVKGSRAKEIVLIDGCPFECIRNFIAEKISYTRRFGLPTEKNTSAGWETIVLPFDVTTFKSLEKGKLLPFTHPDLSSNMWTTQYPIGYKPFWLSELNGDLFSSVSKLEANVPYIIAMPNNHYYHDAYNITGEVVFSGENTTVYAPIGDLKKVTGTQFDLFPTFRAIPRTNSIYCLNREIVQGLPAGSAFVNELREVLPFEAYVRPKDSVALASYYRIDGGEATGMEYMNLQTLYDIKAEVIGRTVCVTASSACTLPVYCISGACVRILSLSEGVNTFDDFEDGIWIIENYKIAVQ